MCLYPKLIKNPKYTSNKKNGGNIPPLKDVRAAWVPIGCENCIECRKQKARGWQVRMLEELKTRNDGKFITLTFSNQSILALKKEIPNGVKGYDLDNAIATLAVRRFLERWRKKYGKSLRHWLVTELGQQGTENIHLHGIIWTTEPMEEVEKKWMYGYMWKGKKVNDRIINYVNNKTVNYIIKYVSKKDEKHQAYKSQILCSPGIGKNYTERTDSRNNRFQGTKTDETYRTSTGHKISMPIYWRNKIYSDREREILWLQRLDKQERWVCGEKVSIKNGYEQYDKLVWWYRQKNQQFGYGTDESDKARKAYERDRRNLLTKERIAKAWEIETKDMKKYTPLSRSGEGR